ncbi:MAG: tetratricopeptide repeat protein [Planctomycetes bacterium]|nr:tetratricopeptide repeat protein [Planctomycetota bacterium]
MIWDLPDIVRAALALALLASPALAQAPAKPTGDPRDALAARLGHPDWKAREAAFRALLEDGEASDPALARAERSADPGIARSARRLRFLVRWRIFPDLLARIGPLWDGFESLPPQERALRVADLETLGMGSAFSLLRRVLELDPHPAVRDQAARSLRGLQRELLDGLNREGCALMRDGKHAEAEAMFSRMLEIDPVNDTALYNLACSASLQGKVEEALRLLREAFRKGYADVRHAREDPDLENLRGDPRFEALLRGGWRDDD